MTNEKILNIINELKDVDIDVMATIDNHFGDQDMFAKNFFVAPIVDNVYVPFKDYGEDIFDSKIMEALDNEGIYIGLAHVECLDPDNSIDESTIFVDDSLKEDLDDDELQFYELQSANKSITFVFTDDYYCPADETTDYGVKVQRNGDKFKLEFALKSGGPHCWSTPSISLFKEDTDDEWVDINSPLNQGLIELIYDSIVFIR